VKSVSGSYRPNPDRWHWELRNWFLFYLVREEAYKEARSILEPAWQVALKSRPNLDPATPYFALLGEVSRSPSQPPHRDPLILYFYLVQGCISDQLRCREDGQASPWVCHAMHAGVAGTALDIGVSPREWLLLGELHIPLLSVGAAFVVRKLGGVPTSDPDEVDRKTLEPSNTGTTFNQWDNLRKQAHEELDRLLDEMRADVESATSSWPNMYQKGRRTRTTETMRKLVRWVVGREEQWGGDRSATNSLLRELGLDPPGKSKKLTAKR
jgi:hypothetical protein